MAGDDDTPERAPIAYLTGEYPAVSHTFILREIEGLRAAGLTVETCSVRRTGAEHHRGPAEQEAARTTFYILAAARRPTALLGAVGAALARPARLGATLKLAWQMRQPGLRGALYQLFYLAEAMVLAQHLKAKGVGHLHNHFAGPSANVAVLTATLCNIPFSFTLHGPADLLEPGRWHLGTKIARADFVACISHFARSQAMLHSDPAHWPKLRIVHCGVTPALYENPSDKSPGQRLIFVGRLAPVKGLRVLMQTLNGLKDALPDLRLTVVGDGPDRAALEAAAAPLGDRVTFTGYQSQAEVADHLAASDIFVLPSFAEGVPVVLMEAMASGMPVIATRIAGIAELVEDGTSGYLVPPGDPATLGEKITALCTAPERHAEMGTAGQRKVTAEFDIAQEARWLAQLFKGEAGTALRPPSDSA